MARMGKRRGNRVAARNLPSNRNQDGGKNYAPAAASFYAVRRANSLTLKPNTASVAK